MQIRSSLLFMSLACLASVGVENPAGAQSSSQTLSSKPPVSQVPSPTRPNGSTGASVTGSPASPVPSGPASVQLQPALDGLDRTIQNLRIDKWKGGTIRAEAATNAASIEKDLQQTLPALITDADAEPRTMHKLLAVSRNVTALYDVVLRVFDGARVAASAEQVTQLESAMAALDKARRALDKQLEDTADTQERLVGDLQVSLKAHSTPPVCPAPSPQPAPVPAPTKKKVPVKKKPKPATASGTNSQRPNGLPESSQPQSSTKPN